MAEVDGPELVEHLQPLVGQVLILDLRVFLESGCPGVSCESLHKPASLCTA